MRYAVAILTVVLLAGCSDSESRAGAATADRSGRRTIYSVNYPLAYFAERIAGKLVEVQFPTPAGSDPAFWSPGPEVIQRYQAADLILLNGAGYASWLARASLPRSRLVDTSRSVRDRYIPIDDTVIHSHGPDGAHTHTGTAFTTWLDLDLAVAQARAIVEALVALDPERESTFESGFTALEKDLRQLEVRIRTVVAIDPKRPLVASHPVYQYLARRYGLNLRSVHWEPDGMPTEAMWQDLRKLLSEHPAKTMIWEGKPLDTVSQKLRELGVLCVVFDPCGNTPEDGDFLSTMQENVRNLARAFER